MWVGMRDSWVVGAAAGGRFLRVRAGGRSLGSSQAPGLKSAAIGHSCPMAMG